MVSVGQSSLIGDFVPVDKYAKLALHVECVILPVVLVKTNLHVLAGDVLIQDLDWDGLIPADDICAVTVRVIITFKILNDLI